MAILPVALCPLLTDTSILEGQLDEDLWILPPAVPFFVRPRVRWITEAQTQVFTSYDSDAFNIAFRCFEDAPERIEHRAGPPAPDKLFQDDLVGFRFIPEEWLPHAERQFHFIMTAAGQIFREITLGVFDEVAGIPCQVQIGDTDWCVEARLPFDLLKMNAPHTNQRWGFAAYRQRVGARWERSGWIEVGAGPLGETMPGWLLFENAESIDKQRGRAIEPYLRRFGQILDIRIHQCNSAEAELPADACPVTRYRIHLMIRSLLSIKNDMLHAFHPDALRHYAQTLQFNVGRLDELIENLRQAEDPHTAPDGFVFLGAKLETDRANHAFALIQGRAYESTMPHPLIVLLNGFSDDWIADSRLFVELSWPPQLDFLMAIPSGVGVSRQYRLASEDELFGVIRQVRHRFSVDPRRMFLLGMGPGAEAAYRLATRFPQLFRAAAIGGPVHSPARLESVPAMPLYYWAGEEDGWIGPLQTLDPSTRERLAALPEAGAQAVTPAFLQQLAQTATAPHSEYDLIAPSPRYSQGQWARIERPRDYSRPAKLALRVMQDGRVNAEPDNVGAFSLFTHDGPFVPGQTVRVECKDHEVLIGSYSQAIHCELAPAPTGPLVKTAELAGPIDEGFHGELLYVYGTAGGEEMAERLREAVYQACRWPQYDLRIVVKADNEVTEEEMQRAHLHLFGGAPLNHLVARMAGQLPVDVSEPAAFRIGGERFAEPGQVCQFIYPNPLAPGRYVLLHLANSPENWLYRGWFPKAAQSEPLPDLWVARVQDNPDIMRKGVAPVYQRTMWFDAQWQLANGKNLT